MAMAANHSVRRRRGGERGFTLIELMVVMAVIGLLAAIAIPSYVHTIKRANEAVLKEDLHTMRTAIDSYTVDKEKAPQGLDDLVQAGYLKTVPIDPMTSRNDTWITSESDTLTDINETQGGIGDVHSGSQVVSTEGTTYNTW
jgi:general secretion pathway protein G